MLHDTTYSVTFKDVLKSTSVFFPFAMIPMTPMTVLFSIWQISVMREAGVTSFIKALGLASSILLALYIVGVFISAAYNYMVYHLLLNENNRTLTTIFFAAMMSVFICQITSVFFITLALSILLDHWLREKDWVHSAFARVCSIGLPVLFFIGLTYYSYYLYQSL